VVQITAPIEDDLLDTLRYCSFGNCLADTTGGIKITPGVTAEILLGG